MTAATKIIAKIDTIAAKSLRAVSPVAAIDSPKYFVTHVAPMLQSASLTAYLAGREDTRQEIASRDKQSGTVKLDRAYDARMRKLARQSRIPLAEVRTADETFRKQAYKITQTAGDAVNRQLRQLSVKLVREGASKERLRVELEQRARVAFSRGQINTIFRTQLHASYAAGQWREARESWDAFWGFRYHAIDDDRVRDVHLAMDGVTLPKDHPWWKVWFPPNGWNCRCSITLVFEKVAWVYPPDFVIVDGRRENVVPDEGFRNNVGNVAEFSYTLTEV